MRKRDKLKGYVPFLSAGMYYIVVQAAINKFSIPTEKYAIVLVLLWAGLTAWSTLKVDKLIDNWDKDGREEDE